MKSNGSYELSLTVREATLPPGMEWPSCFPKWSMIQVGAGSGYWVHPRQNLPLEPGSVLIVPPHSESSVRSSQVGPLSVSFFCVDPLQLMGLVTPTEQTFFRTAAAKEEFVARSLSPEHPVAARLRELFGERGQAGSLLRLQLLEKFIEVFGDELNREPVEQESGADAKQRLQEFLQTTPASELINLSFDELVNASRCTPRHMSRIFRDVTGMSFREKRAELRLTHACHLLASTKLKIVDVALESGFQSLSLFNLMFARRFAISPGKWRKNLRETKTTRALSRRKRIRLGSPR